MIRAFTISFKFQGRTYLALVTVKKSDNNDVIYSVRVYDDALTSILPDKTVSYSNKKPFCPSTLNHPQASRLFGCINEAVEFHIESSKQIIR